MKYLYTDNATQEYKGKGREYYKFEAVQTLFGWVGVLKCNESLAAEILEVNPKQVREIDEEFYSQVVKKKDRESKSQNYPSIDGSYETSPSGVERKGRGCGVCGS